MIRTARSSSIRFSSSSVAIPSSPGIMMSTIAASNGTARASSSPSLPDAARRTSYPSRVNKVSRISRMISSSSTTRIVPLRDMVIGLFSLHTDARRTFDRGSHRQPQDEAGALPDRALAADRPVVLVHDAVGNRQAQAGAAADRLGGEK